MAYEKNTTKEHPREWLGMEGFLREDIELTNEGRPGVGHARIRRIALPAEATAKCKAPLLQKMEGASMAVAS